MNTLQIQRTEKIKQLLNELNGCLKMSVEKAIEIGKELHEQKESLRHGEFLPWLENNFELNERTAQRYMKLYRYHKNVTVSDLQTAYQQIEQIEQQERRKREIDDNRKVEIKIQTGRNPAGWERRHDQLLKARIDEAAYQERKKVAIEDCEIGKSTKVNDEEVKEALDDLQNAQRVFENQIKQEEQKAENRKKLRISSNNEILDQEIWFESFRDYLYSFDNVNRRLEIIQNFIKYLKGLGTECQREIVKGGAA